MLLSHIVIDASDKLQKHQKGQEKGQQL